MSETMVGTCSELADGDYRIVAVGELEVGIFRLGERFVAYENRCPHHGGPVCQGKLFNRIEEIIMPDQTSRGLRFTKDRHVVCPWHGYEFNLDTGHHPGDPRVRLRAIPVRVSDDRSHRYARLKAPTRHCGELQVQPTRFDRRVSVAPRRSPHGNQRHFTPRRCPLGPISLVHSPIAGVDRRWTG
jgi:nitrite reductase/ring-hydroxylating ferredoxin subunit